MWGILRKLAATIPDGTIPENIPGYKPGVEPDLEAGGNLVRDNILMWVFIILGTVAVIMLIYGGIQFMMSQGDAGKAQKARQTIIYAIIGVIVVIAAGAITNFVLGALG